MATIHHQPDYFMESGIFAAKDCPRLHWQVALHSNGHILTDAADHGASRDRHPLGTLPAMLQNDPWIHKNS